MSGDSKKKHHDKEHGHKNEPVLGYVSFSATGGIVLGPNTIIPLTNVIIAENIDVSPLGGLVIKKSGIYGITFNTNLASGVTAEYEIYANTRLIASVSNPPGSTLAKVAKIVAQLEKNEVLQVKTTATINLFDANLTAAKLD
ncbi:hypothetical protein [Gottfriedia acidiceleris]|uniref:hypothetical protein n=1 Tax=Gottfriedia acidiceleris TaxID=371036 RepID=UPI000B441833|nr:hypothetical protein [Gottfriedia acidiceleris]